MSGERKQVEVAGVPISWDVDAGLNLWAGTPALTMWIPSTVAGLMYSVDSSTDWQTVLPSDKIADSPEETYGFAVPALSPGAHQITVRATDAYGNQAFEAVTVTIEAPTAQK